MTDDLFSVRDRVAIVTGGAGQLGREIVAARDLELGQVLTADDVAIKSPADGGLPPYELDRLVGRRLRRPVASEDFLTFDDVEPLQEQAGAHVAARP